MQSRLTLSLDRTALQRLFNGYLRLFNGSLTDLWQMVGVHVWAAFLPVSQFYHIGTTAEYLQVGQQLCFAAVVLFR